MTLGMGIVIYAVFLAVFIGLIKLTGVFTWFSGGIPFFAYLIFGFLLNRIVLRGLIEWHPVYNTLHNVANAKLTYWLFWPLTYPILFFKLLINRIL